MEAISYSLSGTAAKQLPVLIYVSVEHCLVYFENANNSTKKLDLHLIYTSLEMKIVSIKLT